MNIASPKEILERLEKKGGGLKEIAFLLFSFIFLRNILEGILEQGHLFGLSPYPYRSFLISFIHFPLFYLNVFLFIVLIFAFFIRISKKEEFLKIAGSISFMCWIIILPPIIDFFVSGGRGYDLSYILKGGNLLERVVVSFNPFASLPGVTIGMRIEIYLALILSFIWFFVKRNNFFLAIIGTFAFYLSLLFLGLLPLLIANIFGYEFSSFYQSGGILFYDTQKFAAILFISFFILATITIFLFFKDEFKEIFCIRPINMLFVLALIAGFLFGLKTFLSIKPDFIMAQDYLAFVVFIVSGFLVLRVNINQVTRFAVIIGLFATLIISYYTFLALLVVVILIKLGEKYGKIFKIIFMIAAFFFAFLTGLTVFTNERVFSALAQKVPETYRLKTEWIEEELFLRQIEANIRKENWQELEAIFGSNPYFVSPPAVVYLQGIYNIGIRNYDEAERYVAGAIRLGYKTKKSYLMLGILNRQRKIFQ